MIGAANNIERGRAYLRNPGLAQAVAGMLRQGVPRRVIDQRWPGVLAALDAARQASTSGAQGETARADAGLVPEPVSAAPAAPVIPTAPERVDWRAMSDAERDALVLAAPADGLRGWLSSRGIAPPDFYRHRAAMAQRASA